MAKKKSVKTLFKESTSKTAHFDTYKVDKSDNIISMNVFPGDTGQASISEAYIEGVKIIGEQEGPVNDLQLGTNKKLRGKFLDVYTLVTDIPGEPDLTSFRFQLNGGVMPYENFMEKTVQSQGDSVVYKISIFFTIH